MSTGPAANGGSCVARHDGRVVFVRYALPGERVRVRLTAQKGSYWHADAVEVLEASPDRIDPLCPVAGVDGAGCCDLAFVEPGAARLLKAEVVANQLARLGDYAWHGVAEPVGSGDPCGWRTRVRLGVGPDGRAGLHRYHSDELVTDLRCGQLPEGMLAGLDVARWRGCEQIHVVIDDDGTRLVAHHRAGPARGAGDRGSRRVCAAGGPMGLDVAAERILAVPPRFAGALQRTGAATRRRVARVRARGICSAARGCSRPHWPTRWVSAAKCSTVDTSRAASSAATAALADVPGLQVISQSVRQCPSRAVSRRRHRRAGPPAGRGGSRGDHPLAGAGVSGWSISGVRWPPSPATSVSTASTDTASRRSGSSTPSH